jgi:hypothetical protein
MCCDGTLFRHATAEPNEQALVVSAGLAPRDAPVVGTFDLPCAAFLDGCCSLYSVERPHVCGAYRCNPLTAYEVGDATLEECAEIIRLVQGLARALEDEMALPPGSFTREALGEFLREHEPRRDPERYRVFLSTFDRVVYLGMRYFGYEVQGVDDTPTETVPA